VPCHPPPLRVPRRYLLRPGSGQLPPCKHRAANPIELGSGSSDSGVRGRCGASNYGTVQVVTQGTNALRFNLVSLSYFAFESFSFRSPSASNHGTVQAVTQGGTD
jgi:hypothetical protein